MSTINNIEKQYNIQGDNYVINRIIVNSTDYNDLVSDIQELQEDIQSASTDEIKIRKSKKLSEKQKQLNSLKENVCRLYETFNKIPLNTERLLQAKAYFDEGKFREADALLNAEEIESEVEQLQNARRKKEQELEKINADLINKSNEYLIKAHIKSLIYTETSYADAKYFFEKALNTFRTPTALYEYAQFLQILLQEQESETIISLYEEALILYKELSIINPDNYLLTVATISLNLTAEYCGNNDNNDNNDNTKAIEKGEEALTIFRQLSEINPKAYLPNIAKLCNNLAAAYMNLKKNEKAREKFEESLIIRRTLSEADKNFCRELAITLSNYAQFHARVISNEYKGAMTKFNEALDIQRTLVANQPNNINLYLELANSLGSLGQFCLLLNEIDNAEKIFEEFLSVRRILAKMYPTVFLPYLASALVEVGSIYTNIKPDKTKSINAANEAIDITMSIPLEKSFKEELLRIANEMLDKWKKST